MRELFRKLLLKPVLWAVAKYSSKPDRARIFKALSKLYGDISRHPGRKGPLMHFHIDSGRFIIFSDQHKGAKNGADDFALAEPNYLAALEYYNERSFHLISLGDNEELWENSLAQVKKYNKASFESEKKFLDRNAFVKIFGNHDLYWQNDPFAHLQLKTIYGVDVKIYEGIVLSAMIEERNLRIFCTHGHQGDAQSDGNWFSKFFVSVIWEPFQAWLRINPNTPAHNNEKKTLHNQMMYDWSAGQKDLLLITGHTHQPVFQSLTLLEQLYQKLQEAIIAKNNEEIEGLRQEIRKFEPKFSAVPIDYLTMKPTYFNSGCCCFSDGDITGLEIDNGYIRLIKWTKQAGISGRIVLEEMALTGLVQRI